MATRRGADRHSLKVSEAIDEKVRTDNGGTVLVALCVVKQAKLQKVHQSASNEETAMKV